MANDLAPRAFLYLGLFRTNAGKYLHGYYDCGPNPGFTIPTKEVAPNMLFKKALTKWGRVGTVYAAKASDGAASMDRINPQGLGQLPPDLLRQAEISHEANEQARKNEKAATSKAQKRLCLEDLKHWRAAYEASNRTGRAAIIARIISYLEERRAHFLG
jgi:hypothetical protein